MIFLQAIQPPVINVNDSLREHTQNMIQQLQTDPEGYFANLGHQALIFGLKVLAALLIYFIGAWLIRQIKKWQQRGFERKNTDPTVASFIASATSFSLTLLLIVVTVGTLGVDTTSLAALLAAGGMAIGMALSGTVQNFAGGLMILAFKPFKVGDWIAAQGYAGTVTAVTITNTKIRTIDNREVVLPNGALSNGVIDNYSTLPIRRIDMTVSVAYGTDAQQCIDLLLSMLREEPLVLDSTTQGADNPFVALKTLNESDISFVVRAFVKNEDFWTVTFNLNKRIYTELPQHGIQFAYPHVDITLTPA
ncbi:MAG: mechanosensitive ion channel family protein [Paludibacteraceae bacterium]|nr:mechanosensitive ion channel family protein [Paludibacteraceae bacterium]